MTRPTPDLPGRPALSDMLCASAPGNMACKLRRARLPRSPRQLTLLHSLALLALLHGCGREPVLAALPPASLDRSQSEALQRMNTAGATAFAGWTWRYEFGAGCRLRVIKRYEGRPIPVNEYVLVDPRVNIVPYAGAGFGVKASPGAKAGSADLFDARNEAQARAFAQDVERLLAACGAAVAPAR
jgi:hypothetical protein